MTQSKESSMEELKKNIYDAMLDFPIYNMTRPEETDRLHAFIATYICDNFVPKEEVEGEVTKFAEYYRKESGMSDEDATLLSYFLNKYLAKLDRISGLEEVNKYGRFKHR